MQIQKALTWAKRKLAEVETPSLDAEILLTHILDSSREYLIIHANDELSDKQQEEFQNLIQRRKDHEPISHIVGYKEFFDFQFFINKHVLTPRPETEIMVEKTLEFLKDKNGSTIVDMGTGSGNIAIALAKYLGPQHTIYAIEISSQALEVAQKNAVSLQAREIHFVHSNLFQNFSISSNHTSPLVIVANLPYIPKGNTLMPEVQKYDPHEALFAGEDGLNIYRAFFAELQEQFSSPNFCIFEFHPPQRKILQKMLQKIFSRHTIKFLPDLRKNTRFCILQNV